jgi:hypothetical protein
LAVLVSLCYAAELQTAKSPPVKAETKPVIQKTPTPAAKGKQVEQAKQKVEAKPVVKKTEEPKA